MQHHRLAVLADIHGNLPALETVLQDLRQYEPLDGILVAGDMIGGPGQQTVLQRLIEQNAVMIQGNGEERVVRMKASSPTGAFATARQFAITRWFVDNLSTEQHEYLRRLPEQRVFQRPGADAIRIVHGSPRSLNELILPNLECYPNLYCKFVTFVPLHEVIGLVSEPVAIFGHTHLQWQARMDGRLAFNPGAVNFPEDDYIGAQYAILHWDGVQWQPTFHRVRYDMERLRTDYQESGFLDTGPLARVTLASLLSGKDYLGIYLSHVHQEAKTFGHEPAAYETHYPDEIWDLAERTFPWATIESI